MKGMPKKQGCIKIIYWKTKGLTCVGSQREIMDELYAKVNENSRKTTNEMKWKPWNVKILKKWNFKKDHGRNKYWGKMESKKLKHEKDTSKEWCVKSSIICILLYVLFIIHWKRIKGFNKNGKYTSTIASIPNLHSSLACI
jgi:hypothetical protein